MKKRLFFLLVILSQPVISEPQEDADTLFNWAEVEYPELFSPPNQTSQQYQGWYYRQYTTTGNSVGLNSEGDVYVHGEPWGGLRRIDALQALLAIIETTSSGWQSGPQAGNPEGQCSVPDAGQPVDTSTPDRVVGNGTPASCTSQAFVQEVAQGGIITFNCGPDPVEIVLDQTAKVVNNTGPQIVIDGDNKVTLSGGGEHRILYQNTCDQEQVWTTPHCQDQDHPQLAVQNLTFKEGNATGSDPSGGGAIFVRGGQFKILNSRFFSNRCDTTGPDVGGAAVRVFDQFEDRSVLVVNSTFGGAEDLGNECSNGGGLSSIGVSYTVINSLFSHNKAIGNGANPAREGTPGGGSGGAIYNDGNLFTLDLCGTAIYDNVANEGGGAIFFVSNNRTGHLNIDSSTLCSNPSHGFETNGYPGIFVLAEESPQVTDSSLLGSCQ